MHRISIQCPRLAVLCASIGLLSLGACTKTEPGPADAGSGPADSGAVDAVDAVDSGDSGDAGPSDQDSGPTDAGVADAAADGGQVVLQNRLANPGFEQGESWWRPSGYVNHNWAATGDPVHNSNQTFDALEGARAQKVWGSYSGTVPNTSELGLDLAELTPGDAHVFSAQLFTHPDDRLSAGSTAQLFLRYLDAGGAVLEEASSPVFDAQTAPGVWHEASVSSVVPQGAVRGALGVRFALLDWSSAGSLYLDTAAWTSSGTGRVQGERLLVWNDEFEGTGLDDTKWTRLQLPSRTFNDELQAYTDSPSNADVSNGQLVITAKREADGSVTSGRLVTDGKAEWTYGRIEAMAQVPSGAGTWPAFWMLPSERVYGGWPDSGEIDIMEHVGCELDVLYATVHTGAYNHLLGTQLGGGTTRDAAGTMHLYAVDWSPDTMIFTVDGEVIFQFDNDRLGRSDNWPFDQTFHVILNLAFGGTWGGWCGADTNVLPQRYLIDWVRVYQ